MEYNINTIFCVDYVIRIFEIQVVPIRKTVNYPIVAARRITVDCCWSSYGAINANGKHNKNNNDKYNKNNGQTNPKLFIHKTPQL